MSENPVVVPGMSDDRDRVMSVDRDDGDHGDTGDCDDIGAAPGGRTREGLPPAYRMRHDPHYVETLASPALPVVPAGPPPARCPAPASPVPLPAALAAAAAALAESFEAIQAALRAVPTLGRPLRDRVSIELARAEATRGRWLADATAVLQSDPIPALDEVDLVVVLRTVCEALEPESRLSGGAAALPLPTGACRVFGDERLLTTAVGASLAAMRAVIDDRGDARKLSVVVSPRRDGTMRTLRISQWAVRLPLTAHERFFEAEWRDHPAGASGALLLAAARHIAVAHGGGLELAPIDGGGCCLLLTLPAAG